MGNRHQNRVLWDCDLDSTSQHLPLVASFLEGSSHANLV